MDTYHYAVFPNSSNYGLRQVHDQLISSRPSETYHHLSRFNSSTRSHVLPIHDQVQTNVKMLVWSILPVSF